MKAQAKSVADAQAKVEADIFAAKAEYGALPSLAAKPP
jgi:hypothetical protein